MREIEGTYQENARSLVLQGHLVHLKDLGEVAQAVGERIVFDVDVNDPEV